MANYKSHFYAHEAKARIDVIPLQKGAADRLWKTSYHKHAEADIGHIRILQGSTSEDAIHFMRKGPSAQMSTETSDVERQTRHRGESDEEVGDQEETEADTELEEKKREVQQPIPRPAFRPKQPHGAQRQEEWKIELLRHLSGSQPQSHSQSQTRPQQIQRSRRERRRVETEAETETGVAEEEE
jgi:hypothetical protein